jgi:hypothetical protein
MHYHNHTTILAAQSQREKPPRWLVLVAICALPLLLVLTVGLLVIRVLFFLFLLYLLGQLYGVLFGLLWQELGQLLSPPGLLFLLACTALYGLLRGHTRQPGQPKG